MSDYLVAVEIEVDPVVRLSAGFAIQYIAVKSAGGFKVGDWEG